MFSLSLLAVLLPALPADLPAARTVKPREVILVSYTEGICFDHGGNAYISHGEVNTQIEPGGVATTFARTGAPNGHKVLADGTHLVCDGSRHAVLRLDAKGRLLKPASTACNGVKLRAPNDLCLDTRHGGFYFTDPGGSGLKSPIGTVHYYAKGKTHLVAKGLAFPNGIVLRPDGMTLLVAESQRNRVLAFPVLGPGKVGKMAVFVDLPKKDPKKGQIDNQPDGMCLDEAGNLYVAHYGMGQVQVVSPAGKVVRRYRGGTLTTSNVAFGGKDRDVLYVTGALGAEQGSRGALFTLHLKGVQGLKILPEPTRP